MPETPFPRSPSQTGASDQTHTHTHTHTRKHMSVLKSSCVCDHGNGVFWHSGRALLWWPRTRKDSAPGRQNKMGNTLHKQWMCVDIGAAHGSDRCWTCKKYKVTSLWTPILETSLWEAFNNTFLHQINLQNDFANVETKIQGINFLMSHKCETTEEWWIGPPDFMSYVLSKSPRSLFSYSVDSFWLKK